MTGGTCSSPHTYTSPSWSSSLMCGGSSSFYISEIEVLVMASSAYPTSYPTPHPTTFPTAYPPSSTTSVCTDSCGHESDGECDDGGPGSVYDECKYGRNYTDCVTRFTGPVCTDVCLSANDGECDDGGHDSFGGTCSYGTDCADCGMRTLPANNTHTVKEGLQLIRYVRGGSTIQAALFEDVSSQQSEEASTVVFKLNTFLFEDMETLMQVIDLWVFAIQQASLNNRKLVIDVIGNGGGVVFLPNILLKILFGYSAEDLCELYDFRAGIPQLDYMLKYFVGKEMQMPAEITDDFLNQLADNIDRLDELTDSVLDKIPKRSGCSRF